MTCNLQVEDEKDCQLKKFYRKERRDFVIPAICCVSIVRFCCYVKCNRLTLKSDCFRYWEKRRLGDGEFYCVKTVKLANYQTAPTCKLCLSYGKLLSQDFGISSLVLLVYPLGETQGEAPNFIASNGDFMLTTAEFRFKAHPYMVV